MRNNPKRLVDAAYIMLLFATLVATLSSTSYLNTRNTSALIEDKYKYEKEVKINDYITCEAGVNKFAGNILAEQMLAIPSKILAHFLENGWSIVVSENTIPTDDWGNVLALYMPGNKVLKLSSYNLDSVHHEMGHYFDSNMHPGSDGKLCQTKEWHEAYMEEKEKLQVIDDYTRSNSYNEQEAFAEVFRLCIEDADVDGKIPKMTGLMKEYLGRLEEQD